ncbi:peptidase, partial [Mycobacterium tuberculosis]
SLFGRRIAKYGWPNLSDILVHTKYDR